MADDDNVSAVAGNQALPGLAGASGAGWAGLGGEVAGLGVQAFSAYEASGYEKNISNASQNISRLQQQQNVVKFAQSQLTGRRNALQEIRNAQVSRSLALASSNQAGAGTTGHSSAYGGAQGQIAGQAGTNLLGINQNLLSGKMMFDLSNRISAEEQIIAQNQSKVSMWQGLGGVGQGAQSLGSSIVKSSTNPSGSLF